MLPFPFLFFPSFSPSSFFIRGVFNHSDHNSSKEGNFNQSINSNRKEQEKERKRKGKKEKGDDNGERDSLTEYGVLGYIQSG